MEPSDERDFMIALRERRGELLNQLAAMQRLEEYIYEPNEDLRTLVDEYNDTLAQVVQAVGVFFERPVPDRDIIVRCYFGARAALEAYFRAVEEEIDPDGMIIDTFENFVHMHIGPFDSRYAEVLRDAIPPQEFPAQTP